MYIAGSVKVSDFLTWSMAIDCVYWAGCGYNMSSSFVKSYCNGEKRHGHTTYFLFGFFTCNNN